MAINTTIATPLTLQKDQALSGVLGKNSIPTFNDSALSVAHYRNIPNDQSNEGSIKWANLPSVLLQDGDYAIAVSMFEYLPSMSIGQTLILNRLEQTGELGNIPDRGPQVVVKGSIKDDNGHTTWRKLVWVHASDLFLGSVAQLTAQEVEAEKKRQQELADLANPKKKPALGNTNANTGNSTTTWIIVAIVFVFIAGIWALISSLSKKRKKQEEIQKNSGSQVNVIRLPKNT